jgi:hypothetical protein
MIRMLMNNKLERMWKYRLISYNIPGGTEERHKNFGLNSLPPG